MIEPHLHKLKARSHVSVQEEQAIRDAVAEVRELRVDSVVVNAFAELNYSTLLVDGILCRYKDLTNGRRQITQLHFAGDFADLQSFTLKYLDQDVLALTPVTIAIVPHDALRRLTEDFPGLARVYWFITNLDAAIQREWELSLGRRHARARLAMLMSELQIRLEIIGQADERGFDLPLTQVELSECTGLTNVHVNRVIRELRESGMVDIQRGRVDILDREALWREAEFDPRYLYLQKRER